MRILNFSHPLTEQHLEEIEKLTCLPVEEVVEIASQINPGEPLAPQIETLLDELGFTAHRWQTEPFIVNLPSLNYSAAVLLAHLHGRMGYFPPVLRLRPVAGVLQPRFEVAEIINLQEVREKARSKR